MTGRPGERSVPIPRALPSQWRWNYTRKAELCRAIQAKAITVKEAVLKYDLGVEEVEGWLAAYKRGGSNALRREPRPEPSPGRDVIYVDGRDQDPAAPVSGQRADRVVFDGLDRPRTPLALFLGFLKGFRHG